MYRALGPWLAESLLSVLTRKGEAHHQRGLVGLQLIVTIGEKTLDTLPMS